jgi:hypothetical protein
MNLSPFNSSQNVHAQEPGPICGLTPECRTIENLIDDLVSEILDYEDDIKQKNVE